MKTLSSQHMQWKITPEHLKWAQNVDKALNSNIDMGIATGTDSSGVYNKFEQGNSSGVLIRIGANSSSELIKWDSTGAVTIQHGLKRQPIGFKIVDKDATVDVWRTAVPTTTAISLKASSNAVNVTLYIF